VLRGERLATYAEIVPVSVKVSGESGIAPQLPDYGTFPRTPADGTDWIHPDDVAVVEGLIPSSRVYRRFRFDQSYYHFAYGEIVFRLKPCLWLPVASEGLDIGDRVETIGVGMQQELFVSVITDMFYHQGERRISYSLASELRSDRLYHADQLRLLTDKTQLRPADTAYPPPKWNAEARRAYRPSDYLQLPPGDLQS
jgi:hypothetical protein